FGVVRAFRTEAFTAAAGTSTPVEPVATSIVSWRVGINAGLPLGTSYTIGSDRAEAIPRKLQIALQDETLEIHGAGAFEQTLTHTNALGATAIERASVGDFRVFDVTVPKSNDYRYRLQRVTV